MADTRSRPPHDPPPPDDAPTVVHAAAPGSADAPAERIGGYRILETVGEGGMGVVYKAEQESPQRIVALKVIKPGFVSPELLTRFERETEVLGRLQHPGIGQIYAAGADRAGPAPRPYFAMEYVDGLPLLEHAEVKPLDTPGRLELMARVCDAVQHAHQRGVIHRDLKPANILVDAAGQPKVLDFGVARVTDADVQATIGTDLGQLVGTLPYMSPEQVGGDPLELDTRSDVYTLGVILFELLSGRRPYPLGRQLTETARIITEEEPPRLGTLDRAWRGDVETIVGTALEKDKTRRYQSAAELAADLRRHLAYQPIQARPLTTVYQLRKFARRKPALVGGVAATALTLILGLIGTGYGLVEATRQRDEATAAQARAESEAAKAVAVNDFLQETLGAANPREGLSEGLDVTVLAALDAAVARLDTAFPDQPEIDAAVRDTIGQTYAELGQHVAADALLTDALRLRRQTQGDDHEEVAATLYRLGTVAYRRNDPVEAETRLLEALAMRRRLFGERHADIAEVLDTLASVYARSGDWERARQVYREAAAMQRELAGEADPVTVQNLALLEQRTGNYEAAEPLYLEALEATRARHGTDHADVGITLGNLGELLHRQGRYREAEDRLEEALTISRRHRGDAHPATVSRAGILASTLRAGGATDAADRLYRETLSSVRARLTDDPPRQAVALNNLVPYLQVAGDFDEAEALLREALALERSHAGPGSVQEARYLENLGFVLHEAGRDREATPLFREARAITEAQLGADAALAGRSRGYLAMALAALGEDAESERLFADWPLTTAGTVVSGSHTVEIVGTRGELLTRLAQYEQAEIQLLASLEGFTREFGTDDPRTTRARRRLDDLYDALGTR